MKTALAFAIPLMFSLSAGAALPAQFSECLADTGGTKLSISDLQAVAAVTTTTICQNQMSLLSKEDTAALIKNEKVRAGISLSKTTYSREELMDLARAGSYVLYVDSSKLDRTALMELQKAGVQVAVVSATAGLSKYDLMDMARVKPFIVNVNSPMQKEDLRDLVRLGTQIVIRSNQSNLTKDDIVAVAQTNAELVTVMP